ncbi:MAG: hypothetical protein MZV64_27185 [Ignavibacteriales bacterium]|nr:hypothetical protein [Ignavibacteriales bacterium]
MLQKIVNQEYSEASKAASSFLNKTVRFIGRLASPSAENATMMRKLPTGIKRLGLVLLLTAPFIAAFKKISHVFFGKPSPKEEAGQASNPAQSQTQFSEQQLICGLIY